MGTMFDTTDDAPGQTFHGLDVGPVAAYGNGRYASYEAVKKEFPHLHVRTALDDNRWTGADPAARLSSPPGGSYARVRLRSRALSIGLLVFAAALFWALPAHSASAQTSQICCNTVLEAASSQRIVSPNGRFELVMQTDGNLVLYMRWYPYPNYALWNSHTWGIGAERAAMQSDGNFVIYRGNTPLWNSNTAGHPYATLVMQNDGNAVIYHNGVALWSTGTGGWSRAHQGRAVPGAQDAGAVRLLHPRFR